MMINFRDEIKGNHIKKNKYESKYKYQNIQLMELKVGKAKKVGSGLNG